MIIGKRIRLRAIESDDLPRFVAWLNDREVTANLLMHNPLSSLQEARWHQRMLERPVEEQPLCIEAFDTEAWELIGNVGLFDFNWQNRSAEIGIFIGDKKRWDQGYGAEAMHLMAGHGFKDYGLHRIFLQVFETNPRGVHCYEKAGFVQEGRLRQAQWLDGRFVDVIVMSQLSEDWKPLE
jgi:RimJ/RimL family protein N-acetyltransferase